MKTHSYVVEHDDGFAPNPFFGTCTLATCKPTIRGGAQVGDLIVGTGSASNKLSGKVVYYMYVDETMTFDEYWLDERFRSKRPRMDASRKFASGDNIYHRSGGVWVQENSLHSREDGSPNSEHVAKDTAVDRVLAGANFCYWGGDGPSIPAELSETHYQDPWYSGRGTRNSFEPEFVERLSDWLTGFEERGYVGRPAGW